MKKVLRVLGILFITFTIFSCASLNQPVAATSNPVGEKVGQSSGMIYFGLFGNADASIKEAAQNGGITEISTVDFETQMIFGGFMLKFTCTVTGN